MTLQDAIREAYAAVGALTDEDDNGPTLPNPEAAPGVSAPGASDFPHGRTAPGRARRRNRRCAAGRR